MGIRDLAVSLKRAVDNRIDKEARAFRSTVSNNMIHSGSKAFPIVQAVDCKVSNGSKVWALPAKNGSAVIVGA